MKTKRKISVLCAVIMLLSILISLLPKFEMQFVKAESISSEQLQQTSQQEEFLALVEEKELNAMNDMVFEDSNSVVAFIEDTLSEVGTNVLTELQKQKEEYEELLAATTAEDEAIKIQNLITKTEQLIVDYENASIALASENEESNDYSLIISAAIAYFNIGGYRLAAELLTHMDDNTVKDSNYVPVYRHRIMSSDLTYSLALGSNASGAGEYLIDGTVNGNDLYYSIKRFTYIKPNANSKEITILDTYDYDDEPYSESLQQAVIDQLYKAQNAGVLIPYKIAITLDVGKYFRVENIQNNDDGSWKIKITNYGDSSAYALYNKNMCNSSDANNWTGLKDINYELLSANGGSIEVNISQYLTATHIAICKVIGTKRYITCADNLSVAGEISQYVKESACKDYGTINLLGKNGNKWIVKVTNTYSSKMEVEYNELMCFENDAKNWLNLLDTESFYLESGKSEIISIQENYLAPYLAVSLKNGTKRYVYYANQINANCTMNVSSNSFYHYLELAISKKEGSTWYINITNPTDSDLNITYNTKMCFKSDAQNWDNLNNPKTVTIFKGQTKEVAIKENWAATTIAVSYTINGVRVISYADRLNTNGTINVMHTQINN